jgi:hypothetical protein
MATPEEREGLDVPSGCLTLRACIGQHMDNHARLVFKDFEETRQNIVGIT